MPHAAQKKKEHHYWIILKSCTPLWNTVHAAVHSFSHSHSVFTTSRRDKQELVTKSGEEKKKKKVRESTSADFVVTFPLNVICYFWCLLTCRCDMARRCGTYTREDCSRWKTSAANGPRETDRAGAKVWKKKKNVLDFWQRLNNAVSHFTVYGGIRKMRNAAETTAVILPDGWKVLVLLSQ